MTSGQPPELHSASSTDRERFENRFIDGGGSHGQARPGNPGNDRRGSCLCGLAILRGDPGVVREPVSARLGRSGRAAVSRARGHLRGHHTGHPAGRASPRVSRRIRACPRFRLGSAVGRQSPGLSPDRAPQRALPDRHVADHGGDAVLPATSPRGAARSRLAGTRRAAPRRTAVRRDRCRSSGRFTRRPIRTTRRRCGRRTS